MDKAIWELKDMCEYLGMSKDTVKKFISSKNCPLLKRVGRQRYRAPKEAFIAWVEAGMK